MSLRTNFGILTLACAAAALPLAAQPCNVAPASVTALSIERTLSLANVGSTLTPSIDEGTLAALTSGAQEIRTRLIYNPATNTLTNTTFLRPGGSPALTPIGLDVTPSQLQSYTMAVDRVYTSCRPPSVMFVGTLSSTNGPFGNFSGAPAAVSIGFTADNPPKITNVVELVAGTVVAYSPGAAGTLTFPPPPPPPPSATAAPRIVITPTPPATGSLQVFTDPFPLNATGTTDPAGSALTYLWTSDKPANFTPSPSVINPLVTFQSGAGDYKITLTVTNAAGVKAQQTFILTYIGNR